MQKISPAASSVSGKVIYVLALVTLVQISYPISDGSTIGLLLYQALYASLLVTGIIVARDQPRTVRLLVVMGVVWMLTGIAFTLRSDLIGMQLLAYIVIAIFQSMVVKVLLRFIFVAKRVTRDVIYAACSVYLLLGVIFVPVFGIIETIYYVQTDGLHAFTDGVVVAGTVFKWQNFLYFSYSTLTTAGYGDILPVTLWARSAASVEAIIGVLYITIVMARLVGLYASREVEEDIEAEFEEERRRVVAKGK